ncbi:hypothetical protein GTGU_01432 [Trabulsiella guamensis ATCC 49490]|uniref:Uncharacterized protein n=1 Tax=Trabulsiella guamensis ATCC 49490 TaxID=1005994 RepID=A0A085AE70_9ENTR|nr:hypothetical protein [Trabulsiella guamensis]KFC08515.1 hypothetical protein GTGU_01432 [Trabulsiella guamensis ATCC 49490]
MIKPAILQTNWRQVINDIHSSGASLLSIAESLNVAKTTLLGWREGATPNHHYGEALLELWCYTSRKSRNEAPTMVALGRKERVLLLGGKLDGRRAEIAPGVPEVILDKEIYARREIALGQTRAAVYVAANLTDCKAADLLALLVSGYRKSYN